MIVRASQSIVVIRDQIDTDGLPAANTHTATLWKNGVATAQTVTVANPTTGLYSFAFTIPATAAQYDIWSLRVIDGDGYASTVWEGITDPIGVAAMLLAVSGATIQVANRVNGSTITAYIGDDYKVRSGTQLQIAVDDVSGVFHAKLAAIGIVNLAFGASRDGKAAGEITGTIAALDYATDVLTITVEITACGDGLRPDEYDYQIQSTQEQSGDYDDYIELAGIMNLQRRTVAPVG